MATSGGTGPGPGGRSAYHRSWAKLVESTLPTSWNKNILEIVLEKEDKGAFNVSEVDCSHLLLKLGIDTRSSIQVESVQICPTGRGVILITFKQGVNIEKFSRYDVVEVTKTGIRAVQVKPCGKKDVVVTIKGLHPNTRDDGVLNYLGKYGKIITNKVVYGTFGEGPLKGIRNGDRYYKVELNPDTNIGTYHAIDGQRVTLRYPGQLQTCARCHETAVICRGGAIARRCEAAQGPKVEFSDHILNLWEKIGYVPGEVEMAAVYDQQNDYDESTVVQEQNGGVFTPVKPASQPEKFSGVNIRKIPKVTDNGEIIEFLIVAGLPEQLKDSVEIKDNGSVTVKDLENSICLELIKNIHNQMFFGKKLYCNGIIALTPEKTSEISSDRDAILPSQDQVVTSASRSSVSRGSPSGSTTEQALPAEPVSSTPSPAQPTVDTIGRDTGPTVSGLSVPKLFTPALDPTVRDMVRRYSWSVSDAPPKESLAADILNTRRNLLTDIQDLKDQLSEFESCVSEESGSGSEEVDEFKVVEKKGSKKKRKASKTPIKSAEENKKANLDWYENSHDGMTK